MDFRNSMMAQCPDVGAKAQRVAVLKDQRLKPLVIDYPQPRALVSGLAEFWAKALFRF